MIRGKILKLATPEYPRSASGVRLEQSIIVDITIDEKGHVIYAKARDGDPALRTAAENCVKESLFSPTLRDGVAVRVRGYMTFNFRRR